MSQAAEPQAEAKTYTGGCHCGAVKYEVTTKLDSLMDCNCSHCSKNGFVLAFVQPEAFKLLSGEDAQTMYQFNTKKLSHPFCQTCGVHSYGWGPGHEPGSTMYYANARCLDDVDVGVLPIGHYDGKSK